MITKLIGLLEQVPLQIGSKEKQELVYNGIFTCITFLVGGLEYANAKVYNDEIFVKNLNAIVFLFQKEGKIFLEGIYNIIPIIRIMGQGFQPHCEATGGFLTLLAIANAVQHLIFENISMCAFV